MSETSVGVGPAAVEEIRLGGIHLRFLMDGPSSGTPLTMFEMSVESGAKVPLPHHHEGFDETIYGLSGLLRVTRDGETFDLGPGDSLYNPRGAVHGFVNAHADTAKVLVVITPGIFGAPYFREMAALLGGGGPPDPKAFAAVMLRYGLVPALA
jgi:quercetin dioxygenase-like cupin family protein